jgi:Matrixin
MNKLLKSVLVFTLLLSLAVSATAYVPQYSEEKNSLKLRWKSNLIKIALSNSLLKSTPNLNPDSDIYGAIKRSLESWEKVADLKFEIIWTDKQSVSPNGNFGDGISLITIAQTPENLLMFSKDSDDVSARTRVFFNKKGFITEADIVLNPYQQFATDGSIGTFDFESILTHEIGHLLGLEHSSVFSATMHENNGKNGVFNLSSFVSRTLAETDISSIRAIYGANTEVENCCGTIAGKLTSSNSKSSKIYSVWAEDTQTGKVVAEVLSSSDGAFRIEGLTAGNYQIFGQNVTDGKAVFAAEIIDNIEVVSSKTLNISKKMENVTVKSDVKYIGFNGQLSELSVPINAGKSYVIYVGGTNLDPKKVKIKFNTPYLTVTPKSYVNHDYGENLSVLSFEVKVNAKISVGEYSISVENESGSSRRIVGGLTVEEFANPWNSNILLDN